MSTMLVRPVSNRQLWPVLVDDELLSDGGDQLGTGSERHREP
jgi:hypothetical protein